MRLALDVLGSEELKKLSQAVDAERKRRGRKKPDNHESPTWQIPNKALKQEARASG